MKPSDLKYENRLPLSIWQRCNTHREISINNQVFRQRLKVSEIKSECETRGGGLDVYEKVLIIEDIAYPMIIEAQGEK